MLKTDEMKNGERNGEEGKMKKEKAKYQNGVT